MDTYAINKRYTNLAEKSCCLSCGGALRYAEPVLDEICVDLGSGRGNDVLRLAEMVGENGFVYGFDISEGMLNKAQRNAEKFAVKNVEFKKSNIEEIPLADRSVDLLVSNCTINHAADKRAVWQEVLRILKKGGRFVVSDIYSKEPVSPQYRQDPVAVSECWAGSVTKDEYIETLLLVGFTDITILEESEYYPKGKIEVASFTIQGYKR